MHTRCLESGFRGHRVQGAWRTHVSQSCLAVRAVAAHTCRRQVRLRSSAQDSAYAQPAEAAELPPFQDAEAGATGTNDRAITEASRRAFILSDTCSFLASDLKLLVEKGEITASRYSRDFTYEDPVVKYDSLDAYVLMIRALRAAFQTTFDLHAVAPSGAEGGQQGDEVTARWTAVLEVWALPWKPQITLTGRSVYKLDPATGLIVSQKDSWDGVDRNAFLSLEGLQYLWRSVTQVQVTPSIETPKYVVLKRLKDYEIRKYEPYLVAETPMGGGAGPASGAGFSELARYIFGGNQQAVSLEMTTPVITTVQPGNESVAMQFVMEGRYQDVAALPDPTDPRVARRRQEGSVVAAIRFAGWPLDYEVVQAERQLRDLLIRDGLRAATGYQLARYNDPSTPPMVRRNEVLIRLEDFAWP